VGCETIYTFIYRTAQAGQGSEYPAVIIPVLTHHYAMLQRNLLYTDVTRGKRLVVVVGIGLPLTDEGTKGRPAYLHESYFFVGRCLPKAAATSFFLMRADGLPR